MDCKVILNEVSSLLESYRGRDKVLRTFCYGARLVGGLSTNELFAKRCLFLSSHLSDTRATLRLLDDLPMLKYSLEYGLGKQENSSFLASLGVVSNIIDQCYFPIEKVAWLAEHKLITGVNSSKWEIACSICWIASIYLSLIRSVRYLRHVKKHLEEIKNKHDLNVSLETLMAKERFEMITCIRLSLDLVHAISTLPKGFLWSSKLQTWHIGLIGTLSSVLGMYQIFAKKKL